MDRKYITRLVLLQAYFLASLFLFLLNELQLDFTQYSWVRSYLNDLLAPCILLTLTSFFLSLFYRTVYLLSRYQLLFFFLYLSFVFEIVLPYFSENYTADAYDLIAYALGIVFFDKMINKKLDESKRNYKAS